MIAGVVRVRSTPGHKFCRGCSQHLRLEEFSTGRSRCKKCNVIKATEWRRRNADRAARTWKEYHRSHREQYRAYDRARYLRHRCKRLELGKKYRAIDANRKKQLAYNRAYYIRNRDAIIADARVWYAQNAERMSTWMKNYREMNRGIVRACAVRYMARRKALPEDFFATDFDACVTYWCNCCAVCGDSADKCQLCMDHWIPLMSPLCPGTVPQNMIPLCKKCNSSKHDLDPNTWLIRKVGTTKTEEVLSKVHSYFATVRQGGVPLPT